MHARWTESAPWPRRGGARLLGAAMLAALVLGLHAGLLGLVAVPAPPPAGIGAPPAAVTVRQIAPPTPPRAATPPPTPRAAVARRARPAAPMPATPPAAAVEVAALRLPSAVAIDFAWRRGDRHGAARLEGRVADGRYELHLEGRLDDRPALRWHSQGTVDEQGLAPERFVAQRGRRPAQAVNFDRELGRVRFSATTAAVPLTPGMQDRLSWLLQLPAIVDAEPSLRQAGARVRLAVADVRGEAGFWDFEVRGLEAVDLADGQSVDALLLVRRSPRPYDTEVAVWLDPAAGHLPVRLRLSTPEGGEIAEFLRH